MAKKKIQKSRDLPDVTCDVIGKIYCKVLDSTGSVPRWLLDKNEVIALIEKSFQDDSIQRLTLTFKRRHQNK